MESSKHIVTSCGVKNPVLSVVTCKERLGIDRGPVVITPRVMKNEEKLRVYVTTPNKCETIYHTLRGHTHLILNTQGSQDKDEAIIDPQKVRYTYIRPIGF